MKKNNFRLQWLPKSQGQLLCFPRTTRWDSCLTETCTDVWHPPGQLGKRQLFTHMSKTSGPPWNCQLGLFNTPPHRRLHRDQQTDSWWQPLLQIHHNVAVTKGTDTIINPTPVLLSTLSTSEKNHLQTVPSPGLFRKCQVTASTWNTPQSLPLRQTNPSLKGLNLWQLPRT